MAREPLSGGFPTSSRVGNGFGRVSALSSLAGAGAYRDPGFASGKAFGGVARLAFLIPLQIEK